MLNFQDIAIKSSADPNQLGQLSDQLSTLYMRLASDVKSARFGSGGVNIGRRLWSTVEELGKSTILLVEATGSCHANPNDSYALRNVSERVKNVGEKVFIYCFNKFFELKINVYATDFSVQMYLLH